MGSWAKRDSFFKFYSDFVGVILLPDGNSVIETFRFQCYFIRLKLPQAISLVVRQIPLRSNITHRKYLRRIKLRDFLMRSLANGWLYYLPWSYKYLYPCALIVGDNHMGVGCAEDIFAIVGGRHKCRHNVLWSAISHGNILRACLTDCFIKA